MTSWLRKARRNAGIAGEMVQMTEALPQVDKPWHIPTDMRINGNIHALTNSVRIKKVLFNKYRMTRRGSHISHMEVC